MSVRDGNLLADKAQAALHAALRSGSLREGQFLSISQLVEILDCPVAPVREAVKHASVLGLLTTLPKRGVRIMEARPEMIRACLDFRMVFDQEGARRRIADDATEGLSAIREHHTEVLNAARHGVSEKLPPKAIKVDLSLHDFLAQGLGNALLAEAYEANRLRIAIIQNARPFLQDRIASAMEEHLAVIDAIEKRDTEAASDAIRFHCGQTMRWWGVG